MFYDKYLWVGYFTLLLGMNHSSMTTNVIYIKREKEVCVRLKKKERGKYSKRRCSQSEHSVTYKYNKVRTLLSLILK
ncbi:uncharacterized protein EV154DRAFT_63191 [Mucor mucedo]|uniref:uncharacterized protein n=1 Tax=Mucor mucedo TaxID=29922 RepID=UPI00221FEDE1|nr:uncharacterized protein EV154DRAFT_63191 [Mucor mucedo]KAI7877102.1 hypothetical protein EV154DRAFT_63191 [Mucor mucedo]